VVNGDALSEFHEMDDETTETNFFFLHAEKHACKIDRFLKGSHDKQKHTPAPSHVSIACRGRLNRSRSLPRGKLQMKASDYIARFLAAQGVRYVFEMSGGMNHAHPRLDESSGSPHIVSMHHEQAAAFAADAAGVLRLNVLVPGVAMDTSALVQLIS
jgi:hypothetical protein